MFKSAGDEGTDGEKNRKDLIRDTPCSHAQPDGQTDQHIAEDATGYCRDRIERDLATRNLDHRLSDRAIAHALYAGQPY